MNGTTTRIDRFQNGPPVYAMIDRSSHAVVRPWADRVRQSIEKLPDNPLLRSTGQVGYHRPYGLFFGDFTYTGEDGSSQETQSLADEETDPAVRQMRLEAVLFLAKTPLNTRKLAQLAHLADGTEARTLVRRLNQLYASQGRSIRIESVAGGYRMLTRPAYAPWLTRLGHLPSAIRLSSPMMETLAVVAYRGPVSRADVESIRGVACGELLRQLMERDLIRISGRSEELGRPYLYDTTKHFLQLFGLSAASALPPIDWEPLQEDEEDDNESLESEHLA